MDDIGEDQQQVPKVPMHKPFQPKFMKELNNQNGDKSRRHKKKSKEPQSISVKKLQHFQNMGISANLKSLKKLPEANRNGNRIFAQWKNNQIHGDAEIYYANGVVFKGMYQNGIKIKGYFKFLQGYEYVGNCLGNKFNGEGSLFYPSGKIITGEWKDYDIVGKGKIEYPSGEVYYGEIKDLKKHGKGYLFFNDGSKYVGEFKEGQINGYGSYFVNEEPLETGNWVNGELESAIEIDEMLLEQEHNFEMKELAGMMRSTKAIPEMKANKGKQNQDISVQENFSNKQILNNKKGCSSVKSLNDNNKKVQKKIRFDGEIGLSDQVIDI